MVKMTMVLMNHIQKIRENEEMESKYLMSIPIGTKMAKLKMLLKGFPQLLDLSEMELYKLHFDDEGDQLFIDFTIKYDNTQKNDPTFNIDKNYPWDFLTNALYVLVQ